jgi:hypothetical protein
MLPSTEGYTLQYIRTLSGRKVFADLTPGAPSLLDIAVALGRIPRFAGHTTRWWPVLLHSFAVQRVAFQIALDRNVPLNSSLHLVDHIALWGLLHDAHEAVTGDIPSPFKRPDNHVDQETLDYKLRYDLGLVTTASDSLPLVMDIVHRADRRVLLAEMAVVRPFGEPEGVIDADIGIVLALDRKYPGPVSTDGPAAVAVLDFVAAAESYLREIGVMPSNGFAGASLDK